MLPRNKSKLLLFLQTRFLLTLCITFFTGSKAFKELDGIITRKFLLKDIPKLSPDKHTSLVEVLHKVDIYFAPKHTHFFYQGMKAR
ncbi:unnamed protein product, partial [Porites evermanni]